MWIILPLAALSAVCTAFVVGAKILNFAIGICDCGEDFD